MKYTETTYREEFLEHLNAILDVMQSEWGFRPGLNPTVTTGLIVRAAYKRKSYRPGPKDHRAKFFIRPDLINSTRKPESIALSIGCCIGWVRQPRRTATRNKVKQPVEPAAYKVRLDAALKGLGMKATTTVDFCLIASVDFNIGGFAHKGQRVYIHVDNENSHRSPRAVARMFAGEISSHRNTCKECGIGVAPLIYRARRYHGWKEMGSLDVPPDAVERLLHPRLSKIVDKALEMAHG